MIQSNGEQGGDNLLKGKNHEHRYTASQCDEGCGCDYIHLQCLDEDCTFYAMADGWAGCNTDHEFHRKQHELDAIVLACPEPGCTTAIVSSRELSRWSGTGEITDPPHATSVWIPCEKHYQEGAETFHCDKDGNEIPIDPRMWPSEFKSEKEAL